MHVFQSVALSELGNKHYNLVSVMATACYWCCCVVSLAGYNHLDVVEHLLENGADVNARDKGGLIPLHNASSYGVCTIYISRRAV